MRWFSAMETIGVFDRAASGCCAGLLEQQSHKRLGISAAQLRNYYAIAYPRLFAQRGLVSLNAPLGA